MAINPNGVAVPAQSKNLDTTTVTTSYGVVHRQVITLADPENPTSYVTLTGSSLNVNITTASIAVTAASLPLPTGAATESTLVALSAKVVNGYSFHRSASNATTTIKSGAGVLKRVTVNTVGSASNTCTIYDNTAGSGTVIAVIDPTSAQGSIEYDLVFSTGLTIVTATGTAADLTLVYK